MPGRTEASSRGGLRKRGLAAHHPGSGEKRAHPRRRASRAATAWRGRPRLRVRRASRPAPQCAFMLTSLDFSSSSFRHTACESVSPTLAEHSVAQNDPEGRYHSALQVGQLVPRLRAVPPGTAWANRQEPRKTSLRRRTPRTRPSPRQPSAECASLRRGPIPFSAGASAEGRPRLAYSFGFTCVSGPRRSALDR